MMDLRRLALGTVQFGLDYGISNKNGRVPSSEIEKILAFCKDAGIDTIDTAQHYGESEKVLGEIGISDYNVVTKVMGDFNLEVSLERLKLDRIYAVMLHREDEMNDSSWKKLCDYKEQRIVERIGVSVYSPNVLKEIVLRYPIDIVQIPLNIVDQRFIDLMPFLKERKIEVHSRSTFLQGLLLMDSIPKYFEPISNVISNIPKPRLYHSVNFCKRVAGVSKNVFGITCLEELKEISNVYAMQEEAYDYSLYAINDERFCNPSNWEV